MEKPLTLLYTSGIRGDLQLLPRLHTFIQRLRRTIAGPTILIDLGQSCDPAVWPCGITQGRSTLIALDAMRYDAANAVGVLTTASRARLMDQVMMAVLLRGESHSVQGVTLFIGSPPTVDPGSILVDLMPASESRWDEGVLRLADVTVGQVGILRLEDGALHAEVHTMPADTPPDPPISGTIDFIASEARYFEKRQGGMGPTG